MVAREFRRSVGAEREREHVARLEAVIHASEPRHQVVFRQQGRHRVGQTVVDAADAQRFVGYVHARKSESFLLGALHRETRHYVEFVPAVLPVFRVGQRIFVHPVGPRGVQHRAVDSLGVGQHRIALVGLRVVEFGSQGRESRIAAADAQLQVLVEFVFQLRIGDERLLAGYLVFVLARQDRVHYRRVVAVEIVVEKFFIVRLSRNHGTERPRAVHQIRSIGVARRERRRRGLSVGLVARIAGVHGQRRTFVQLLGKRQAALILLVARIDDYTVLARHRQRHRIFGLLVHVDRGIAEQFVLPVYAFAHAHVVFHRPVEVVQIGIYARRRALDLILHEFGRVHHLHFLGHRLESVGAVICDYRFAFLAFVGLDDNDTVGAAGTVDRRRRGILQHRKRGDVRRVDRRARKALHRESVDHIERRVALRQRVGSADHNIHLGSRLSVGRRHRDTRQTALERLVESHHGSLYQIIHLYRAERSRNVFAGLLAVADFDYHVVDRVYRLLKRHFEAGAAAYRHFLFRVSQQRENQHVAWFGLDQKAAVGACRRAPGRSFYQHHGPRYGLPGRVDHFAADFSGSCGRLRRQRAASCRKQEGQHDAAHCILYSSFHFGQVGFQVVLLSVNRPVVAAGAVVGAFGVGAERTPGRGTE